MAEVDDPYKFFRMEARDLIERLSQGLLLLEKGEADANFCARMLRDAHTLKGAARVMRLAEIAKVAHEFEELIDFCKGGDFGTRTPSDCVPKLLAMMDVITAKVNELGETPAVKPAPARAEAAAPVPEAAPAAPKKLAGFETVRLELAELDQLAGQISQANSQLGQLRKSIESGSRLALRQLEQAEREFELVQDTAQRLRLVPAGNIFQVLERAALDSARAVGKQVRFEGTGGDLRMDGFALMLLREGLLHVVSNAVDHGIEPAEERRKLGKPETGVVHLAVERRGSRIVFLCSDDGRGIDLAAVRAAAVKLGVIDAGAAAKSSDQEAAKLIFRPGLSTARKVSEVSGRGVGMDVLQDVTSRLGGEISVRSEPGRGSRIEISVPSSVSMVECLQVRAGVTSAFVPVENVRRALRMDSSDIVHADGTSSILFENRAATFYPLTALLGGMEAAVPKGPLTVVIVEASSKRVALGVDSLMGVREVVSRPLPALAGTNVLLSGVSLDSEGVPVLLLEPEGLVGAASGVKTAPLVTDNRGMDRPVLVIDDSLTTRMLEQRVLESAGYKVELATSAEEALRMASEREYGLFLVDVEMPGMNGFDFVRTTRQDVRLREVPAIIVTSLGSEEDLRRGKQAGAAGYMVKGQFDEARLLDMIRGLIGKL